MDDNDASSTSPEPDLKRRKLRKGTRSCWDCKKRKVKCTFESATESVCIACRRRGAPCVGQEHPEAEYKAEDGRDQLSEHVVRVEALLEDLIKKFSHYVERDRNWAESRPSERQKSGVFTPFSDIQSTDSFVTLVSALESIIYYTRTFTDHQLIGTLFSRKQRNSSLRTTTSYARINYRNTWNSRS
jgi:hypothetical protein